MKPRLRPPNYRLRLHVVVMVLALAVTGLIGKALAVQILGKDFYQRQGNARHLRKVAIPAYRGTISDRNGEPLAVSTPVASLWAEPAELLGEGRSRLPELAGALGIGEEPLLQRLVQRADKEFVYLKRHVSPDEAAEVIGLDIPGVHAQREFRRYYPAGEALAHVIGYTDIDDVGQEGLELAFQDWLAGKPGSKRVLQDSRGHRVEDIDLIEAAQPGKDLQLSIDRRIQYLAWRELKAAITEHGASSGSVVIIDVPTGEVLAMVNQPSYNPNQRERQRGGTVRNRAATDVFEPGSTIKPFTIAAALESGKFTAQTKVDTAPGQIAIGTYLVKDIRNFGLLDVTGVITKSSNVGSIKIGRELDSEAHYDVLRRFGFGAITGSGFPGESPGVLPDHRRWGPVEKAALAYGYGLSVTPLQLANAYAALANGGRMRTPTFVKGGAYPEASVIDPMLAEQVLAMLETVTGPAGTARQAAVPYYRVGGKSGTSRKAGGGGYQDKRYISLFAGIAPVSAPRLACVVVINDPRGSAYFGGLVAAPVFGRVVGGALRLMDVPPDSPLLLEAARSVEEEIEAAAEAVGEPAPP
ncbi:MAG: penicillin-binding protein 2 [Xanthomonadales bacterium]|nr:Peptidoglycan D,D-transpeptidase FtsI [Xanthomonadales bacterium]MCC6592224.1 penicillin-binding protein 2 [Xanthomonadales bacterium]MCE7932435.1 penicillin-binding protein 2 [Xanthomonadales bacterium PRO6]